MEAYFLLLQTLFPNLIILSYNTQRTSSSPSPSSLSQCQPSDGSWFLLLWANGPFYQKNISILQSSYGFCIASHLEIHSGCFDSFVFCMLAPWVDMDYSPPSQPRQSLHLHLNIKAWWQVPSYFFMLLFYPCHNSPQVRASSLTYRSFCSDIRGENLSKVTCFKTEWNCWAENHMHLELKENNLFVLEKQMHCPVQNNIKQMETMLGESIFNFASTKPQWNNVS